MSFLTIRGRQTPAAPKDDDRELPGLGGIEATRE